MPHTPMRGLTMPDFRRAAWPRAMVRSTRPGSILAMASIRPMWVVTWRTFIFGVLSIIETSGVPVRCASNSVCPGNLWPAACNASLFNGAVQMAATLPSRASCAAMTRYR